MAPLRRSSSAPRREPARYGQPTGNVTYAIDATRGANGNFVGNYSVSGLPSGVSLVSFSPPAGDATGSNPIVDTTLTLQVANTVPAASYNFTVTLGGVNGTGTLVVSPKTATVTADNKSKSYGDDNPALTATVTGTVNGDTLNFTLATAALKFSNAGDYPITVALGSNPNYTVTKTDGTLHIDPKAATVTADNKTKTYGDDNPALTATVTGTVNGDTLSFTLATAALKFSNAGDYPITVTLGSNPNYNVTPTNGTLHIDPKTAAVTANNKTKTYGDDNPTLTATVTGTVNGDTLNFTLATTALKF